MENNNRSVLKFNKYIVKEISFYANEEFKPKGELDLKFNFDVERYISEDGKKLEVMLSSIIFQNAIKNNYPFEMRVCLKGFFDVEGSDKNIEHFVKNATAILFPYLRSIVSTYTANANIIPVILPPMNINAYFEDRERKRRFEK